MQDNPFASSEFLLCDADGCLFPSEQPAFDRSAQVLSALFAQLGFSTRYEGEELRRSHTGQNFRLTAADLSRAHGVDLTSDVLEYWVQVEKVAVTDHLSCVLQPDVSVQRALAALTATLSPAVVTSSAIDRLGACLRATRLSEFFDGGRRFSAEDSLPAPVSKPDPAIYLFAREQMRLSGTDAVVIEDSVAGVEAATGAGLPVVGLLHFVPAEERAAQRTALKAAGATAVAESWEEIVALLNGRPVPSGSR